jgi:hypothetical protein
MTHAEDTAMEASKPAARDASAHRVRAHPKRGQLVERDYALLALRDACDRTFPLALGNLRQLSWRNRPIAVHSAMVRTIGVHGAMVGAARTHLKAALSRLARSGARSARAPLTPPSRPG